MTARIFDATLKLIEEDGFSAVTFQRVAERARVGRATLYRRWPEPAFLVGDAIAATAADHILIPDTGSLRDDLAVLLEQLGRFIDSSAGRASIVATLAAREHPDFEDFARQLWERRKAEILPVFERARSRSELRPDDDTEMLFAALAGSLYLRMIVMAEPVDKQWVERVIEQALRG